MYRGSRVHDVREDAEKNATDPRLALSEPYRPARETFHVFDLQIDTKRNGNKENQTHNVRYKSPVRKPHMSFIESLGLTTELSKRVFQDGFFLYLKRRPDSNLNSVYNLQVCEYKDININDYFTLSKRGVCRFAGKASEFHDLESWEKTYSLFNKLQDIRFFRKFCLLKSFLQWRKLIRTAKIGAAREQIRKSCFIANIDMVQYLYKVREASRSLEQKDLLTFSFSSALSLQKFKEAQDRKAEHFHATLVKVQAGLLGELQELCSTLLDNFQVSNKIELGKSISFLHKILLRRHKEWISRFVRLIDLMLSHALRSYVLSCLNNFAALFVPENENEIIQFSSFNNRDALIKANRICPVILVRAYFEEDDIDCKFSPKLTECIDFLEDTVTCSLSRLQDFQSFSQYSYFEYYGLPSTPDNLCEIICATLEFQTLKNEISAGIEESYTLFKEYGDILLPFREIYLENLPNYKRNMDEIKNLEIKQFENYISHYVSQQQEFSSIPIGALIDNFEIESYTVKETLLPSPLHCLDAITRVLPEIIQMEIAELRSQVLDAIEKMKRVPQVVKEFTSKCAFVERLQEAYSVYTSKFERVSQVADLMNRNKWNLENSLLNLIKYTKNEFLGMQNMVEQFLSQKSSDTQNFVSQLKESLPRTRSSLISYREKLDNPLFFENRHPNEVLPELLSLEKEMAIIENRISDINQDEAFLNLEISEFPVLGDVQIDFKVKNDFWKTRLRFCDERDTWLKQDFKVLDTESMERLTLTSFKIALKAEKAFPHNHAARIFLDEVNKFKSYLVLVEALSSSSLKKRHWEKIDETLGFELSNADKLTLEDIISKDLEKFASDLQQISVNSKQEQILEDMLDNLGTVWFNVQFEVNNYKEHRSVYILGSLEEVLGTLDDSLVTIATILSSRYVFGVKERVQKWKNNLHLIQETVDEWIACQRNWIYLESIFAAADIQRQLPSESKSFFVIDTFFKNLMVAVFEDPNVYKTCTSTKDLLHKLVKCNEDLEAIQKSLEDYLETKRSAFPRFYFLSNDELLQILSQTKDVQCVQPHLRKCFDALHALDFGPDRSSINIFAMISPENERILLSKNLKARGNVEDWLTAVENSMRKTLKKLLKEGLLDSPTKERAVWVKSHPGQVVATIAQVRWADRTESAILNRDMGTWYKDTIAELQELIILIRGNLTKRERKVIVALVTTDVHARDIVERLKNEKVHDIQNFVWQMQLRYYFNMNKNEVEIKHSDALIQYAHEYQGCTSRLVITPLTDRCWLTITGALNLKLGAAPAGPAGTGKTESSKDLAKALGVQCIVFNCSDQIDYKMMGKLFMGLAQTGAWTCLDEFNRIDIEVLSVVAQQLLLLRQGRLNPAQDELTKRINFMGSDIVLLDHHVIVTMNPGYAGRTELPDNLKVCFRPVSMMVPDYALIAEIMLFAEGFGDAKTLSRKMIKLFHLSSQQLSQQPHYDYGLRAVKSVLVMAGGLKRGSPEVSEELTLIRALQDSNVPKCLKEDLPLFYAIVKDLFPSVEVPENDYGNFREVIVEEIRRINLQPVDNFVTKIIQQFDIFNIRFGATIVGPTLSGKSKCYEVLRNAMLTMKSRQCGDDRYQNSIIKVLNPKCISMGELYGEFNQVTQEWEDGLASTIMRQAVDAVTIEHAEIKAIKKGKPIARSHDHEIEEQALPISNNNLFVNRYWIVFDGPIDALWIENMNTVLDDNMTLCLANGERIKLVPEMKCLFEVNDLEVASPATVSRLGVMYMSPEDLGSRNIFLHTFEIYLESQEPEDKGWLDKFLMEELLFLYDSFFDELFLFHSTTCTEPIKTSKNILVSNLCKTIKSLLEPSNGVRLWKSRIKLDAVDSVLRTLGQHIGLSYHAISLTVENAKKLIEMLFIFSLSWTLGGLAEPELWDCYDKRIRDINAGLEKPIGLPPKGILFEYFVNCFVEEGSAWEKFDVLVPKFDFDPSLKYFDIFVDNVNSLRYEFLCKKWLGTNHGFFLTGKSGCGKTALITSLLTELSSAQVPNMSKSYSQIFNAGSREGEALVEPVFINFSAQTSSLVTQSAIESRLEKKRKVLLGAPANKKVVIFIDDINMPLVEEYGAQQPIELLRFLLDRNGLYDRDKLYFKSIVETILVVCGAPPGGGRHPVTPRFKRHFCILNHGTPSKQILFQIFNSIFSEYVRTFNKNSLLDCTGKITNSVVALYERMKMVFLPTPKCFHYSFNLRDVSKIFQGMLQIRNKNCAEAGVLARLCIHETERVLCDRLISTQHKENFWEQLTVTYKKELGEFLNIEETLSNRDLPILFSSYCRPGASVSERQYEEQCDEQKLVSVLSDFLDEYNLSNTNQMNLIFFRDALEKINSVTRILAQPRGNAFLIGVGGCGKRSVARLAAFINEIEFFQIEITRNYGIVEFREDLKQVILKAGVEGIRIAFLFTDSHIVDEIFVEDINSILNSGEVANLFLPEEEDKIVNDMTAICQKLGIPESRDNIRSLFLARVRENLKIVLAMSPVGDKLRIRCRNFPSLINSTTIVWFSEWPTEALEQVAVGYLKGSRVLAEFPSINDVLMGSLVDLCSHIHTSVIDYSKNFFAETARMIYTTPKSYLDLINLYLSLLESKKGNLQSIQDKMRTGVQKLTETNALVDDLKVDLVKLQPVLVEKKKETSILLEKVAKEKSEALEVEERVSADEAIVQKQKAEVAVVQADAQKDLDSALPALQAAIKALDALDKKDITEIKSFAKPPPAVQLVMESICLFFNLSPSWDNSKKLLSDGNFMKNLQDYDKDNIPEKILKKVKKLLKEDNMQVEVVKKVSKAATSLCLWAHAMNLYSDVAKTVEPKRQLLAKLTLDLSKANELLAGKQNELQKVRSKVELLEKTLNDTLTAKRELEDQSKLTENRLVRAEKLTSGLADEGERWKTTVEKTIGDIKCLIGNTLLAAACTSYYGGFSSDFRSSILSNWISKCINLNIPLSQPFALKDVLSSDIEVKNWQACNLPTDDFSVDNAILSYSADRWPLFIDPQQQGLKWIKQYEKENGLIVVKASGENCLRSLEGAIRNGQPLLIENIGETLDPSLDPVLGKEIYTQGGRTLIHLGDSDIDYDVNFKLFLCTKLNNPHYLPEVCIKVTIINFCVTQAGLSDQLLGIVVKCEKPEIEKRKAHVVQTVANDVAELNALESKVLQLLSESKGNVLDDQVLIDTLADSKQKSTEISKRLVEAEKTKIDIEESRNQYQSVASFGSMMYFCIADLAILDPMYQFSLTFFCNLFEQCLRNTPQHLNYFELVEYKEMSKTQQRLLDLQDFSLLEIFRTICRGLFEKHKLVYASLLCIRRETLLGHLSAAELKLLTKHLGGCGDDSAEIPSKLDVVAEKWNALLHLISSIRQLGIEGNNLLNIVSNLSSSSVEWNLWIHSEQPFSVAVPDNSITNFEKLLLVKVFRPECLWYAVVWFVQQQLTRDFVDYPTVTMAEVYKTTSFSTPCIFILSAGADPTDMLLRYAKEAAYDERISIVSLGQGQGEKSEKLIRAAKQTGDWVLLQNCHLAKSWMGKLETIVMALEEDCHSDKFDTNFRLFLTSLPAQYFPISVLQNGVKLTNEPPKGIRANLVRSFETLVEPKDWETCTLREPWKKLSIGLAFFHAIVQERRKFGPLGWNIRYEFNDTDLETSLAVLRRFLDSSDTNGKDISSVIPWAALRYVTGEINYGGRVTDDWDRRCLMTILDIYSTKALLTPGYRFSKESYYFVLDEARYDEKRQFLKNLPAIDNPSIFGMNNNAEIAFQVSESLGLLHDLGRMQYDSSQVSGSISLDEVVVNLCDDLLERLPKQLISKDAGSSTFKVLSTGLFSSLDTVLLQEMSKFNRLLELMDSTMKQLKMAIKGLIVMSLDLDNMYRAFSSGVVPPNWLFYSFASRKPLLSWFTDLNDRVSFLLQWLKLGQPFVFPLNAFFFPQGFITGVLQTHARKYRVAVDELSFNFTPLKMLREEVTDSAEDGVFIDGIFLEGASFDIGSSLVEEAKPGEMYCKLPPIHMWPVINHVPCPQKYLCPVYKTSERQGVLSTTGMSTNFVIALELDTSRPPEEWVLTGCAALLNLDH